VIEDDGSDLARLSESAPGKDWNRVEDVLNDPINCWDPDGLDRMGSPTPRAVLSA